MESFCDKFQARITNQTISSVTLEWDAIPDAEVYKVELKHKKDMWQRVYWGSILSAKVNPLDENFCYKLRISAMKMSENEGYLTLETSNIIRADTLPLPPSTMVLYRSIRKGEQYLVKRLLQSRPDLVNITSPNGYSPLANAIINLEKDIVDVLLSAGASVHVGNLFNKRTPLHLSFYYGLLSVSRMLINKKANINAIDCLGMTPCHYAVDSRQFDMLKFALENKCDIEAKDFCGWTLLLRAIAMQAGIDIVKLLISNGSKLNSKDKNGYSCLQLAKITGKSDIINCIENALKK